VKYFVLLFTISAFTLIPIVNVRASSNRYWTGYYFYNYTGSAPWGVKANIFTEWLEMPMKSWAAEWVSVVLEYYPDMLWIQTGYRQFYTWIIFPIVYWRFYYEIVDGNPRQYNEFLSPIPLVDHTYTYAIWHDSDQNRWRFAILEGWTWHKLGWLTVEYETVVDLQAFVETITTQTNIGGSHFSQIAYYNESAPLNWRLWNQHDPHALSPYSLDDDELDYEFYAYGGYL